LTLIIVLNVVFSASVVFGIVALHLHAIAKSHAEQAGTYPIRVAMDDQAIEASPRGRRDRERGDAYSQLPAPARA
jgi:hypothetical protein